MHLRSPDIRASITQDLRQQSPCILNFNRPSCCLQDTWTRSVEFLSNAVGSCSLETTVLKSTKQLCKFGIKCFWSVQPHGFIFFFCYPHLLEINKLALKIYSKYYKDFCLLCVFFKGCCLAVPYLTVFLFFFQDSKNGIPLSSAKEDQGKFMTVFSLFCRLDRQCCGASLCCSAGQIDPHKECFYFCR